MIGFGQEQGGHLVVTKELLAEVLQVNLRRFDKQGEAFTIKFLHCINQFVVQHRMLPCIGFAEWLMAVVIALSCAAFDSDGEWRYWDCRPACIELALNASEVYERLGSPEGELALAEAVVYPLVRRKVMQFTLPTMLQCKSLNNTVP